MSEDITLAVQLSAIMRQDQALQDRLYDLAEEGDNNALDSEVSRAIGKPVKDGTDVFNKAYFLLTPASAYDATGD